MHICSLCKEQIKKMRRGTPHVHLIETDERRLFKGAGAMKYEEQDYKCLLCSSKFTWSSNKHHLTWTLWQG